MAKAVEKPVEKAAAVEEEKKEAEPATPVEEEKAKEPKAATPKKQRRDTAATPNISLDPKAESELGLVATVLGCRENRDRIEFAEDLRSFIEKD